MSHDIAALTLPAAYIEGGWCDQASPAVQIHRNPSMHDEVLARVPIAEPAQVTAAAVSAQRAFRGWSRHDFNSRLAMLSALPALIEARSALLARNIATEIGKPITDSVEEVRRAVDLLRRSLDLYAMQSLEEQAGQHVAVARRPHGAIGIVTPWNNPIAIPIGKLAPALAFGNTVVWKPAYQAAGTTIMLMDMLAECGLPPGVVNIVFGDAGTVIQLAESTPISAMSFTGSCLAGREVASFCAKHLKPLQAELGGNNPAVIMSDADMDAAAAQLAVSAFSFAGQRCTSTRRIIIDQPVMTAFLERFLDRVRSLRIGNPLHADVRVGPLISRDRQLQVGKAIAEAADAGCDILCGGHSPQEWPLGAWFIPTVVRAVDPQSPIVQQETFGPVVVIQSASGLDEAIALCNGVRQGLVASIYTRSRALQDRFLEEVEAGILKINQPTLGIEAEAPFGGWKESGLGPPEHGVGDREFYTRIQARYRQVD